MTSISTIAGWIFSLDAVYLLTGLVLVVFALLTFADQGHQHRIGTGIFWLILGAIFALGSILPHWIVGVLVLIMVVLDGAGQVGRDSTPEPTKAEQIEHAGRLKNKIFLPVIIIPIVTFLVAAIFRILSLDVNKGALVGLGFGGIAAMIVGLRLTKSKVRGMMQQGRRLNETMGSVNILPQLLASLGVIFTAAKVGDLIAGSIHYFIAPDNLFLLVLANCVSMSLFTMVMGNTFAAFPVIATGVLVPLIIKPFGVNPAMAAIITLTAGSSGTLITPMAANFDIVPAALLNMRDQYGVIKFQLPYAAAIWTLHVLLMWGLIRAMM